MTSSNDSLAALPYRIAISARPPAGTLERHGHRFRQVASRRPLPGRNAHDWSIVSATDEGPAMTTSADDRRRFQRIDFDAPTELRQGDRRWREAAGELPRERLANPIHRVERLGAQDAGIRCFCR